MDNRTLADRLRTMAHELQEKNASLYRVQAYRRAAETILGLEAPIQDMMACQGRKGLRQLPGIGAKLSQKIEEILTDVASNLPRVVS